MAGKPAARLGDTAMTCNDPADAPTGTVIAAGTVLINNMPAAKQGDQVVGVDIHIIMIPTPGGPVPTPLPHPFSGIIDSDTISSVLIAGMPAAVVGSSASNTPPHIPQGGPFQKPPTNKAKIMMGSPNVFIGDGSGGGGGGGGTGGSSAKTTSRAVVVEEGHFLDVKFVDKGGKPITGLGYKLKDADGNESKGLLSEKIIQKGIKEGSCDISLRGIKKAAWSKSSANVGDKVKLTVETVGLNDGEEAELEIFIKDSGFADKSFKTFKSKANGDKIEVEWEFEVDKDLLDIQKGKGRKYSSPAYYFIVRIGDIISRSNVLKYQDWIELQLKDEDGKNIGGAEYSLHLANGQIKKGKLDDNGYAKIENLPPGKIKVTYDVRKGKTK
ncbi:MAG: hypothetical protein ABIJ45_10325 [Candidatus Zixiibacteriota bacterium]